MFARLRIPTIFQRARYQQMILQSLGTKLLSPYVIPEIPNLVQQFSQAVQTDLSPSDIQQLVCLGQKMTMDNVQFVAFPDEMFGNNSTYDPYRQVYTYTLAVDDNKLREYLAAFMQGTWPEQ